MRESEWNPAEFIWNNKTHRSADEAFRDGTYAEAIWVCQTETSRALQHVVNYSMWIVASSLLGFIIGLYIK